MSELSDVFSWRFTAETIGLPTGQQILRAVIFRLNQLGCEENWRASRALWPLVEPVPVITTVLGDSRPVKEFAADGDFLCPYCTSPIFRSRGQKACENPACDANPGHTPGTLTRVRAKRTGEEKERADREQNRKWSEEWRKQQQEEHWKWEQEQIAEAKKRGACLRCLFPSYGRVKFIRHRVVGGCPKERQ